jgi:hypothetical protein
MKIFLIVLSIYLIGLSGFSQDISLTVTQKDLALVKETRLFKLNKGQNLLALKELPSRIEPSSVNFFFSDQSVKLLEFYYAYDLENSQTMLNKNIGKSIRVLHSDLGTVQGKLISARGGMLVIEQVDGELRVITNYGDTHFIIEKSDSQNSLITEPTVFCSLESRSDQEIKTDISYSSTGLNWSVEYTAIINERENKLTLSTNAVISNYSGKKYQNCELLLLAGEINRQPALRHRTAGAGYQEMDDMVTMASEPGFQESKSFEYHSYLLGRNITLENLQQKILQLYQKKETDISKVYSYHHQKNPTGISVIVTTTNSKKRGLGQPLPAGTVRILKSDNNRLIILGEDRLSHTPVEEEIKLKIGQAFDILAERKVLDRKREGKNTEKVKISIEFRNRKDEDIEILATEPITRRYEYRILSSNIEVYKKQAKQVEFIVPVKANQTNTLEFEILYTW